MELTLRVAAQPAPVSHVPRAQPHSSFPKLPTLAASIGTGIVLSVQSLPALRGRVLLGCGLLRVFADSSSGVLRPFDFLSFPQSDAQFLRTNNSQSGEVSDNGEAAPGQHCHERGQGPQLEILIGD